MKHILTALLLLMSVQSIYAQSEIKGDPDPRDMDFNHNEAKGQWYTSLTVQLSSSNAENEDQFIRELKQTFVFKENQYAGVFVYNYESEATSSEIKMSTQAAS